MNEAATYLNTMRLSDLWLVSSLLSCVDFLHDFEGKNMGIHPLFPILNQQKVVMFDHAILLSHAREYKERRFSGQDFKAISNDLIGAADYPLPLAVDASVDDKLLRGFAPIANAQLRFQDIDFRRAFGRTIALYKQIPEEHEEALRTKHDSHFVDIPSQFKDMFKLSIGDFLMIGFVIFALYMVRYARMRIRDDLNEKVKALGAEAEKTQLLYHYLERTITERSHVIDSLAFRASELTGRGDVFTAENVTSCLNIMARTTKELNDLYIQERFRVGELSNRFHPLERYPIVLLDRRQHEIYADPLRDKRYVVPNLRYFGLAITTLPQYMMQECCPKNEFNEVMGSVQEQYLKRFVADRLPSLVLIPEIRYEIRHGDELRGPDLTLVDPAQRTLIVIESKAKIVTVASRVDPLGDQLLEELEETLSAFELLPRKIGHLKADLPEYQQYQQVINRVEREMCVVVIAEGLIMMQEVLNLQLKQVPDHSLRTFTYPYCLMDVRGFEKAVEIAASNQIPLYDVLWKYWNAGFEKSDPSQHASDQFGGLSSPRGQDYPDNLFDSLLQNAVESMGERSNGRQTGEGDDTAE